MVPLLLGLLTLIGGRPILQKRSINSHDFTSKISVSGFIFSVLHTVLLIYCDYKAEAEVDEDPDTYVESNNIMRGIVELSRVVWLLQEPVLAFFTFRQSKDFCSLLVYLEDLDEYLESGVRVKRIYKKMLYWDRIISSILLLVTCINFGIVYILFDMYYQVPANPHDLYNNLLPITNFLLHIFVTCCYLMVISMRMDCYIYILNKLFASIRENQMTFTK